MSKYLGYTTLIQSLNYIKTNATVLYLSDVSTRTAASIVTNNNYIVSCNVSSTDFTVTSATLGAVLSVGAKNNQLVEGSGNATHLYLIKSGELILVTTVSAQILASGNTVNIGAWTVTALASANNS